jgi:glycosyltransferase involved in cell wall biosynthesis
MIRILETESSLGWGGQEQRTVRLVNHLDQGEFQTTFAVAADSVLYQRRAEIRAQMAPISLRRAWDPITIAGLSRLVRRSRIDVISTHSGKDGWLGALVGRLCGRAVVRTRHLQIPVRSPLSFNLSTAVVAVSHQVADQLRSQGVRPAALRVIHTGIDTDRFRPERTGAFRAELGLGGGDVLLGIVAVLRRAKCHTDLLQALTRLPANAKLAVVGDGPQADSIRAEVAALGLGGRVFLLGHRDDVPRLLPDLDIFVLPSSAEALGTAILEASACGVPVVASRVGGIPECVIEHQTGLLTPVQDPAALAQGLASLVDDPALRQRLGKQGRAFVARDFSVARMVERTEALYRDLAR